MAAANLNDIRKYFGYESAAQFHADWMKLTSGDRDQIKNGIGDGSLNY